MKFAEDVPLDTDQIDDCRDGQKPPKEPSKGKLQALIKRLPGKK